MASMNAAWHARHPMPEHASFDERVRWHEEHMRECGCRKPPADIAARIADDPEQAPAEPAQTWSRKGPPGPRSRPHRR